MKKSDTFLSKTITKGLFFVLIICFGFFSNVRSQTIERQLCGHAWQQRPSANIVWNFQENGEFLAMHILVSKGKKISLSGFILKKGTFIVNDATKTLRMRFDSSFSVYSNDNSIVTKDTATQEWHLISVTDYKIVLSRPVVWDFEKRSISKEPQNIIVTMDGGKKKREEAKSKR